MTSKEFNIVRACFWLIAFVIGAHVVAVFASLGACLWHANEILEGKAQCDANGKLTEILAAALAASLAFAGGHIARGTSESKKSDYDENNPDGV
jgi:hypothetical protein